MGNFSGATSEQIQSALNELRSVVGDSFDLPKVLAGLWEQKNGFWEDFDGNTIIFHSTQEICERNVAYVTEEGFVAFANDGGATVAVLESGANSNRVFLNRMYNMSAESMVDTGMSLSEWLQSGGPFEVDSDTDPDVFADERVVVKLVSFPARGLKGLLSVKKVLGLEQLSLGDLKSLMGKKLPITLCEVSYIKALRGADIINAEEQLVRIWRLEDNKQLSLENVFDND